MPTWCFACLLLFQSVHFSAFLSHKISLSFLALLECCTGVVPRFLLRCKVAKTTNCRTCKWKKQRWVLFRPTLQCLCVPSRGAWWRLAACRSLSLGKTVDKGHDSSQRNVASRGVRGWGGEGRGVFRVLDLLVRQSSAGMYMCVRALVCVCACACLRDWLQYCQSEK